MSKQYTRDEYLKNAALARGALADAVLWLKGQDVINVVRQTLVDLMDTTEQSAEGEAVVAAYDAFQRAAEKGGFK